MMLGLRTWAVDPDGRRERRDGCAIRCRSLDVRDERVMQEAAWCPERNERTGMNFSKNTGPENVIFQVVAGR